MKEEMNAIGGLFKDSKTRNILFIVVILIVIGIAFGVFTISRSQKKSIEANIPSAAKTEPIPSLNTTPGASTSPEYNKKVAEQNIRKSEIAMKQGDTFLPTITNQDVQEKMSNNKNPLDMIEGNKEVKPSEENRAALNPQILRPVIEPTPIVSPPPQQILPPPDYAPPQPEIVKVADSKYSDQDAFIIDLLKSVHFSPTKKTPITESVGGPRQTTVSPSANNPLIKDRDKETEKPKVRAGTIINAVLETEINSKEPSPVLAKIISGEYSGARLIGRMNTTGEKVFVEFYKITIPRFDRSLSINAVAIDYASGNKRTALASDVDHHYFRRYGLAMAAAFLQGWGVAIARQNTTTSVSPITGAVVTTTGELTSSDINKQALGEVGRTISSELRQNSDNKPTVYVYANEPIGVLFMDDWFIKETAAQETK